MPYAADLIPPPREGEQLTDKDFLTACRCGRLSRLDEAIVDDTEEERVAYFCPNYCESPIVTILKTEMEQTWATGHRYGEWVLRNPFDLVVFSRDGSAWVKITYTLIHE